MPGQAEYIHDRPHSREAEEALLGAVMIDSDNMELVGDLPVADFYIHRHRFIWGAYQAVRAAGLDVDYVSVTAELDKRQQLDEIGGGFAIADLIERTPNAYNAESYAAIIRGKAKDRRYLELAANITKQAYNGGVDEAAAIEVLTTNSQGEREGRHIGDALDDLETFILERQADPRKVWGIPTGFVDLDNRTGGLHKKKVMMLSGESGTGKTTLALQACLHAALKGYGVAIFEMEMSEQAALIRMVELHCGVPYRAIMSGYISDEQVETFRTSKRLLSSKYIYINDDPGLTTSTMRGVIARARTKQPVDLVMLDYLGRLCDDPVYGKNDYDQTAALRFVGLCKELDAAGVAIQDMRKSEGVPDLQDASGGSKVRYAPDDVYFIVKDKENKITHYLIPAKERYGDLTKETVTLRRVGLGFENARSTEVDLSSVV